MGQIFVAILGGVCSRDAGQLRLWSDCSERRGDRRAEYVRVDEERVERGGWIVNN